MPVSFESIPANWRMPLYWVEFDPSMAGVPINRQPGLIIGTMLPAGTAAPDVPIPIASQAQADEAFGAGSQIASMFRAWFANNFAQELWGAGLAEPGAGTAGTGTITVAGPATAAGTIALYVAGRRVNVAVGATDTATEIGEAIEVAINADTAMPVTANNAAGTVTLTTKWKGTTSSEIDMRDSYYGSGGAEFVPAGVTLTYSNSGKLAAGTGVPALDTLITNMGEQPFDFIVTPFTDSDSLTDMGAEMGFSDTGRWGWMRQLFGQVFSAARGNYATMLTFAASINDPTLSIMAVEIGSPSPAWDWAAAYGAKAARGLTNDPARPLQSLELSGVLPAPGQSRYLTTELNSLSGAGIATQQVKVGYVAQIARETTTYQKNRYGNPDDAYNLCTTMATLTKLVRNQRHAITSKFPRHKLANDGTRFGVGQKIVTPKIIKAELVAQYRGEEFNGLVEDMANFKKHLIVERDGTNADRVNVLYPPDLVNGLRQLAVLVQFRLQFDRGVDTTIAA